MTHLKKNLVANQRKKDFKIEVLSFYEYGFLIKPQAQS